jgi:hypothetical protein
MLKRWKETRKVRTQIAVAPWERERLDTSDGRLLGLEMQPQRGGVGGRDRDRTCDPSRVKGVRYRCATRPKPLAV